MSDRPASLIVFLALCLHKLRKPRIKGCLPKGGIELGVRESAQEEEEKRDENAHDTLLGPATNCNKLAAFRVPKTFKVSNLGEGWWCNNNNYAG